VGTVTPDGMRARRERRAGAASTAQEATVYVHVVGGAQVGGSRVAWQTNLQARRLQAVVHAEEGAERGGARCHDREFSRRARERRTLMGGHHHAVLWCTWLACWSL